MASKSSLIRKRRRYLQELEKEYDDECRDMQASASVSAPAPAGILFDELNDQMSNNTHTMGAEEQDEDEDLDTGGGDVSSVDIAFNTTNHDKANEVIADSGAEETGGADVRSVEHDFNNTNNDDADALIEDCGAEATDEDFCKDVFSFLNDFQTLQKALRYMAIVGHLSRSFVNLLLAILSKFGHPDLPKDARTLVGIPKVNNEIEKVTGGHFWYPGIEVALRNVFKESVPEMVDFKLQIFIDGLPLFKSSATQFWPILFKVEELPDCPVMIAGIFCGKKKTR
uniref:Uncharacterized protein n=1 Tax=Anopheles atroparvus TaxID=41427 RepID=A0AAG5DR64_ANOAO